MTTERKIIVNIATSGDGYIARPDGDIEWLSSRPAPKGFYGIPEFLRTIDTKLFGRKTFEHALRTGVTFDTKTRNIVLSRQPPPASVPAGIEFVTEAVGPFAERLRGTEGKDIWLMGGGGIIGAFLDEGQIDEFIISVIPTFIGEGIPLIAPRHRLVPLQLLSAHTFPDGVVQLHYRVQKT